MVACSMVVCLMAACGGPHSPLIVGVKDIDTDVLIGPAQPSIVASPPAEPVSHPIGFPGFVQPPVIIGPPPPSPLPAPSCPQAKPGAPIAHEVTSAASNAPVPKAYQYRNNGIWTQGSSKGVLPSPVSRIVKNVVRSATGGGFTFDVAVPQQGDTTSTTSYHVYPSQPTPADPTPGIYIEKTVTEIKGQSAFTFTPIPALEIMQFPAASGVTWSARGVDPFSQIAEQFTGTITGQTTVDACGTLLRAWTVEISNGIVQSPLETLNFSATLEIVPQYGGLSVADKLSQTGTKHAKPGDAGESETVDNTATILQPPEFPS
ncbi:MAG: hypothetical protein NVSMB57_17470 [Actinomycetota bacterium]